MSNTHSAPVAMATHARTRAALLTVALAVSFGCPHCHQARAQQPEAPRGKADGPEQKASLWMKQKLVASRDILDGLTRADYEQIEKNARSMQLVGYLEGWARADVPGYKAQLRAFDRANDAIVHAAQRKNLDGATLAYAQLMISCVQCHAIVRDAPR